MTLRGYMWNSGGSEKGLGFCPAAPTAGKFMEILGYRKRRTLVYGDGWIRTQEKRKNKWGGL